VAELPDLSLDRAPVFLRGAGLDIDEATATRVTGTIAAGPEHHTPWGVVHGGVYTTAVESACSVGASLAVIERGEFAVGVSNQTDFLRPHVEGELRVTATPIQQGRTQQLWLCEIARPDGKLVARGQLRLQNVPLPDSAR
jgi:1,4-dihydroxy-2-naphthoyl-CoA hydrolase